MLESVGIDPTARPETIAGRRFRFVHHARGGADTWPWTMRCAAFASARTGKRARGAPCAPRDMDSRRSLRRGFLHGARFCEDGRGTVSFERNRPSSHLAEHQFGSVRAQTEAPDRIRERALHESQHDIGIVASRPLVRPRVHEREDRLRFLRTSRTGRGHEGGVEQGYHESSRQLVSHRRLRGQADLAAPFGA